jgi:small-conductance mechanosensitive channel
MQLEQWTATLTESAGRVTVRIMEYLPNILGAAVLLLVGWGVAKLLRYATRQLFERILHKLARSRPMDTRVQQPQSYGAVPDIASSIIYWAVLVFFVLVAAEVLQFQVISSLLGELTAYLPRLFAGLLILFVGLWLAEFTRAVLSRSAARLGADQAELLGRMGQVLVWLIIFSIAAGQIGIDNTLLVALVVTLFGVGLGAIALAFALGARTTVSNILAAHSLTQIYSSGDVIRIGALEGRILRIGRTHVVLETSEGTATVPAMQFSEQVSLSLSGTWSR